MTHSILVMSLFLFGCSIDKEPLPQFPDQPMASEQDRGLGSADASKQPMEKLDSGVVPETVLDEAFTNSPDMAHSDDEPTGEEMESSMGGIASIMGLDVPTGGQTEAPGMGGGFGVQPIMEGNLDPEQFVFGNAPQILSQMEMNGSVGDVSGRSNPGRIVGAQNGRFVDSPFGQSLAVSSGQNALHWPYMIGFQAPWTVEIVFSISDTPWSRIKILCDDADGSRGIWLNKSPKRVELRSLVDEVNHTFDIANHNWSNGLTYMAFVSSSDDELAVYLNGRKLNGLSQNTDGLNLPQPGLFFFSQNVDGNNGEVDAQIEAIRISSTVRSDDDFSFYWNMIKRR